MRWSVLLLISGVFLLLAGALLYRSQKIAVSDKLIWMETNERSIISTIRKNVQTQFESWAEVLNLSTPLLEVNSEFSSESNISKLISNGVLKGVAAGAITTTNSGEVIISKLSISRESLAKSWLPSQLEMLASTQIKSLLNDFEFIILPLWSPANELYTLFIRVNNMQNPKLIQFAAFAGSPLNSLFKSEESPPTYSFLINHNGEVFGFRDKEYLGHVLEQDPVVKDGLKLLSPSGSGQYLEKGGIKVHGAFEQLQGTNLLAIAKTPIDSVLGGGSKLDVLAFALGLILLVGSGAQFLYGENQNKWGRPVVPNSGQVGIGAVQAKSSPTDKNDKFSSLPQALIDQITGPVSEVLEFFRVFHETNSDSEVVAKEKNRAAGSYREILPLLEGSGQFPINLVETRVSDLLETSVEKFRPIFFRNSVTVDLKVDKSSRVNVPLFILRKIFNAIFENSVEAVASAANKHLMIYGINQSDKYLVVIEDSGTGMAPEVLANLYTPFYSTKTNHSGLGLTLSHIFLFGMDADFRLIKKPHGDGTRVEIIFPSQHVGNAKVKPSLAAPAVSSVVSKTPDLSPRAPTAEMDTKPSPVVAASPVVQSIVKPSAASSSEFDFDALVATIDGKGLNLEDANEVPQLEDILAHSESNDEQSIDKEPGSSLSSLGDLDLGGDSEVPPSPGVSEPVVMAQEEISNAAQASETKPMPEPVAESGPPEHTLVIKKEEGEGSEGTAIIRAENPSEKEISDEVLFAKSIDIPDFKFPKPKGRTADFGFRVRRPGGTV